MSWRDAQHLVIGSVRSRSDLASGAGWSQNAAGLYYSKTFGFGLVDVEALTRNARDWAPVGEQLTCQQEYGEGVVVVAAQGREIRRVALEADECR